MYTNVPIKDIFRIISEDYEECIAGPNTQIELKTILEWTKICIQDFAYIATPLPKCRIVKQKKGIVMGNKLSYILSEIVTAKAIDKIMKEMPNNTISFLYKYVDDILIGYDPKDTAILTEKFKKYLPEIPITFEQENPITKSIEYLDMDVTRKGRDIRYSWLRKSYVSDKVVNYFSAHPWSQKKHIFLNITNIAFTITNHKFLDTAIRIKLMMERNSYPENIIKNTLYNIITQKNLKNHFPDSFIRWMNPSTQIMSKAQREVQRKQTQKTSSNLSQDSDIECIMIRQNDNETQIRDNSESILNLNKIVAFTESDFEISSENEKTNQTRNENQMDTAGIARLTDGTMDVVPETEMNENERVPTTTDDATTTEQKDKISSINDKATAKHNENETKTFESKANEILLKMEKMLKESKEAIQREQEKLDMAKVANDWDEFEKRKKK